VTAPPGDERGRARGRYAKGERRRAQILETALDVFTEGGFHASSTKEIARRVGVTEPTLFHYFGSKQALLAAVLAARDERARTGTGIDRLLDAVRANAAEPDLVRLYAVTSAEATDPGHAAHEWFVHRYERLRADLAAGLAPEPATGLAPDRLARLLVAAADGLQLQWLLDRESQDPAGIDMVDDLRARLAALVGPGGSGVEPLPG
jgi:AcrR family transcriptional regulator